MLHDRAPVERTRVVEPIVTVEHALQPGAFAARLEQLESYISLPIPCATVIEFTASPNELVMSLMPQCTFDTFRKKLLPSKARDVGV